VSGDEKARPDRSLKPSLKYRIGSFFAFHTLMHVSFLCAALQIHWPAEVFHAAVSGGLSFV